MDTVDVRDVVEEIWIMTALRSMTDILYVAKLIAVTILRDLTRMK
jgi:hypothetical protein